MNLALINIGDWQNEAATYYARLPVTLTDMVSGVSISTPGSIEGSVLKIKNDTNTVTLLSEYLNDRTYINVKVDQNSPRTICYLTNGNTLVIETNTVRCNDLFNSNIIVRDVYNDLNSNRRVLISTSGIQMTNANIARNAFTTNERSIDINRSGYITASGNIIAGNISTGTIRAGTILADEIGNPISGIHLTRFGLLKNVYPDGSVYALYNRYNVSLDVVRISYKLLDHNDAETNTFNVLIDNYDLLNTSNGTCSLPKFVDFVLSSGNNHSYFRVDCERVIQNNVEVFFNYNTQSITSIQLRFKRTDNSTDHTGQLGFYFGVFFNQTSAEILSKTITTYRYRTSTPYKVGFAPQRALAP